MSFLVSADVFCLMAGEPSIVRLIRARDENGAAAGDVVRDVQAVAV